MLLTSLLNYKDVYTRHVLSHLIAPLSQKWPVQTSQEGFVILPWTNLSTTQRVAYQTLVTARTPMQTVLFMYPPQSSRINIPLTLTCTDTKTCCQQSTCSFTSASSYSRAGNSPAQLKASPPRCLYRLSPLTVKSAPQQPLVQCREEEGCNPECGREGMDLASAWQMQGGGRQREKEGLERTENRPKPRCWTLGLLGCHLQPSLPWDRWECTSSGLCFLPVFLYRPSSFFFLKHPFVLGSLLAELELTATATSPGISPLTDSHPHTPGHYNWEGSSPGRSPVCWVLLSTACNAQALVLHAVLQQLDQASPGIRHG